MGKPAPNHRRRLSGALKGFTGGDQALGFRQFGRDAGLLSSPSPAMRCLPALFLTACAFGCGLAASSYGRWIATAPTARDAAPFVLPFALTAVGAGASVACAAASMADTASRRKS